MSAGLIETCARKRIFRTRAEARQAAREIGDRRLSVYRCWPHSHYHGTSIVRKGREAGSSPASLEALSCGGKDFGDECIR